jgi:hypothetical protein
MTDAERGKQFPGKKLESFRDHKSGARRILGADFSVVVQESGDVAVHYEQRIIRVASTSDPTTKWKLAHQDDVPPRSQPARRRGSR